MSSGSASPEQDRGIAALWSVSLGDYDAGMVIRSNPRGGWLATGAGVLAALTIDGQPRWEVETLGRNRGPHVASDGTILQIEGDQVVVRDPETGAVLHAFDAPHATRVIADPWGGVVHNETRVRHVELLHRATLNGARTWSMPLPTPKSVSPIAVDDIVLVHADGRLRALGEGGDALWAVGRDGFRDAQERAADEPDEPWISPRMVGETTLLVGFLWYSGRSLFLVNTAARTVERYVRGYMSLVTVRTNTGFRLTAVGAQRKMPKLGYQTSILQLDETGAQLWEHWMDMPPSHLLCGPDGVVFVTATPTRERWEKYGRLRDMSPTTYVRCLGPDGQPRWTWYAPGPQEQSAQLGSDGVLYARSEGQLWALPTG